jgi:CDP-glycerol glycerophosphotransferase (TagB/SpsB family)
MRIGFYVRNAFQVEQFRPFFKAIPGSFWVGKSQRRLGKCGVLKNEPTLTSRFFLGRTIEMKCDIILTQGGLPNIRKNKAVKYVGLQYSYAKGPYTFGTLYEGHDLVLAYGSYAARQFSKLTTSIPIGHPKFDKWVRGEFKREAEEEFKVLLDQSKKTVLYAPTWGGLSSLPDWLDEIEGLSRFYNVIIKPHHNSIRDGQILMRENGGAIILPDGDLFKLMSISDVVISDISGAIFDAVLCEKPVVLVSRQNIEDNFGKKLDNDSIEIYQREEFGIIVSKKSELLDALKFAIRDGSKVSEAWRDDLFETEGNVLSRFKKTITEFSEQN